VHGELGFECGRGNGVHVRRIDSSWWLLLTLPIPAWTLIRHWQQGPDYRRVLGVIAFLLLLYVVLANLWHSLRSHEEANKIEDEGS
jgi:hypothetical protein